MAGPHLVVVPPTPISLNGPRPSPTSTATTSTAPATPRLSLIDGHTPPRDSGESVFSIYDMYGRPGSWAASTPNNKHHTTTTAGHRRPVSTLTTSSSETHTVSPKRISQPLPSHSFRTSDNSSTPRSSSGLIYTLDVDDEHTEESYVTPRSGHSSSAYTALSYGPGSRSSHAHYRPPSSYRGSPAPADDATRTQTPHTERLSASFGRASPALGSIDPYAVPLPPSTRSSFAPHSARNSAFLNPSSSTPPPPPVKDTHHLSPKDAHVHVSPVAGPSSTRPRPSGDLSSHSLVPSEGEDSDSFFVRNTYAQLDASGVKGDGFVEGVERTRARIGPSRSSEIMAEQALADGTERSAELSKAEADVLSSLDRYGFFTVVSHDRLVGLSSTAFARPFAKQATGSTTGPATPQNLRSLPAAVVPPKEESRIAKWERMLEPRRRDVGQNIQGWTIRSGKERKFRSRVYKGIPDRWRAAAWPCMMAQYARTGEREFEQLKADYRTGLERPSEYDVQIDLDVPRTISGHVMFRTRYGLGQRSLFHVLHSFSLRCGTCGYVQGMGPIAATLLCYSEPEAVYAALVRLHDAYKLHDLFSPGFPGLLESIYVQERLMEEYLPAVYTAFKKHMVSTTAYATKWYITLFSNSVPFQTQLRLWDVFFLEGQDAFVVIALAVVWAFRDHITSASANFETVLSLLSSFFVPEDEDSFILWIGGVLGNAKLRTSMATWRQDWKALVAAGKDGDALL